MRIGTFGRRLGAAIVILAALPAPMAQAGDAPAPGYLMTAGDLRLDYGQLSSSDSNDLGRVLPSSCQPPNSAINPVGRASESAPYRAFDYADGTSIQNTVYVYPSPAAASASFTRLRVRTLAACQGDRFTPYGDDEAPVPQVVSAGARRISAADSSPRFSYGQSIILLDPTNAPPGYADLHAYGVFALVDNAIVQVQIYSTAPISSAERADIRQVNRAVALRYAADPSPSRSPMRVRSSQAE